MTRNEVHTGKSKHSMSQSSKLKGKSLNFDAVHWIAYFKIQFKIWKSSFQKNFYQLTRPQISFRWEFDLLIWLPKSAWLICFVSTPSITVGCCNVFFVACTLISIMQIAIINVHKCTLEIRDQLSHAGWRIRNWQMSRLCVFKNLSKRYIFTEQFQNPFTSWWHSMF